MVISYKCPGCGDDMAFDAESGTLACRSCGRQDKIENIPEELKTARFTEDEATEYHCQNCGAILITEKETTATSCSLRRSGSDRRPPVRKPCSGKGHSFYDQQRGGGGRVSQVVQKRAAHTKGLYVG